MCSGDRATPTKGLGGAHEGVPHWSFRHEDLPPQIIFILGIYYHTTHLPHLYLVLVHAVRLQLYLVKGTKSIY